MAFLTHFVEQAGHVAGQNGYAALVITVSGWRAHGNVGNDHQNLPLLYSTVAYCP
jgi:hypothetical protein